MQVPPFQETTIWLYVGCVYTYIGNTTGMLQLISLEYYNLYLITNNMMQHVPFALNDEYQRLTPIGTQLSKYGYE